MTKPSAKGLPVPLINLWAHALPIVSVHLSGLGYQHTELLIESRVLNIYAMPEVMAYY